jgi:hypothetical protein
MVIGPYPENPPYYFPPAPYLGYGVIGAGIAFGAGYLLGNWASRRKLLGWGYQLEWRQHQCEQAQGQSPRWEQLAT